MYLSDTYPLPNFKSHCWGWGALTDTNTITAHALLPALGKQKRKFNCIGKLKNEKYSTFPDTASTLQGHGWFQRPTALQAAAPSAAGRPPWPSHPCPSLSLASPALGVTATAGHGGALVWPVQALNPPRACRKWEFLTSGLLLVVEDQ